MGVVRVLSRKHQANELKRIKIIGNQRAAASVGKLMTKKHSCKALISMHFYYVD